MNRKEIINTLDSTIKAKEGIVKLRERQLYQDNLIVRRAYSVYPVEDDEAQVTWIDIDMGKTSAKLKLNLKQTKELRNVLNKILFDIGVEC